MAVPPSVKHAEEFVKLRQEAHENNRWLLSVSKYVYYLSMNKNKYYIDNNGYRRFIDSDIPVHRWVAEKKLGRRLRDEEVVHHKDRDKLNNHPSNLWVFKNQYDHDRIHQIDAENYGAAYSYGYYKNEVEFIDFDDEDIFDDEDDIENDDEELDEYD